MTDQPQTLFDKVWRRHVVAQGPDGRALLYIDRHLLHDGSFQAFEQLRIAGRGVRRPGQVFGTADHYVPTATTSLEQVEPTARARIEALSENARAHGIVAFGPGDARRGIAHVVGPEQGITQPGMTLVCGDSHTSTHGALGAIAFGIGASEVAHVLATQTLWQQRPKQARITIAGRLRDGVSAKDLVLALIAQVGANGGSGHMFEYAGPAVRALDMAGRMTMCNMTIEAGARCGLVAPDDTTFNWLAGRPFAPTGAAWDEAVRFWRTLPSDEQAAFDREIALDAGAVSPMVTWGTSPQDAAPIDAVVPDPAAAPNAERRASMERALEYMDLRPGTPLASIKVDRVFIGSCTNSRLADLRAAAAVVRGRRARVPAFVSPGSGLVKAAAEAEGLDRVFRDAGFEWRESGCSMCVGMNGDRAAPHERVASTSNRNFEGRQGQDVRTHLMSPAMAAAAAVTGRLIDVRGLLA